MPKDLIIATGKSTKLKDVVKKAFSAKKNLLKNLLKNHVKVGKEIIH
jgi:hypothetical protein